MYVAVSFQIQCTLNACTLITIVANTHALVQCNEFAAKQQKEHKLREKRFTEPFLPLVKNEQKMKFDHYKDVQYRIFSIIRLSLINDWCKENTH